MVARRLFKGKLYPDRRITIGFNPQQKAKIADKRYDREQATQPETDYGNVVDWLTGVNNIGGEYQSTSEAPLFIEGAKSSRKPRGSYGSHGITKFGKCFVRNSAILLERKYGKSRLGFVTCTLPVFTESIQRRINSVWGEIVRRFYQKIKRHLKKLGVAFKYVGVTEIQEKRFRKYGLPVPHLHFVYVSKGSKNSRYYMYICQIHRAWNCAIREGIAYSGYPYKHPVFDDCGSVHAKVVKKSVAAYLGKYVSKGCNVLNAMKEAGWTEFPKQWWNADTSTKMLFKDSIVHLDTHICSALFYTLGYFLEEKLVTWATYVDVEIDGEERTMGLVATASPEFVAILS